MKLNGLVAAPFTPLQRDGSLNLGQIEQYSAMLVANGVSGAFICGTTGEGASLTTAERMQVAERWVSAAPRELKVIVHVGHASLADCRTLAQHAEKNRAHAVGCLAPYFFKPASIDDLVSFCAEVAAAAPAVPFYYYHMPSITGVSFSMADFLAAAENRIPTLAGIKFTYENLMDYERCVSFSGGRYDILFGRDEMLLAGLATGCRGAIGSSYNYAAPLYQRLMAAFSAGDLDAARREQGRANEMIAVMIRHGGLQAAKAIMGLIGLDCGPVRLPLRSLNAEQISALRADLEKCGFFEYRSRL
ncbi:MAG TPA: dihydrodipicolinate synthase family protein [Planctomycetota bacterium]|nr:dihydrodipicolinate synthase family protein [Planctomycetota bacterium]